MRNSPKGTSASCEYLRKVWRSCAEKGGQLEVIFKRLFSFFERREIERSRAFCPQNFCHCLFLSFWKLYCAWNQSLLLLITVTHIITIPENLRCPAQLADMYMEYKAQSHVCNFWPCLQSHTCPGTTGGGGDPSSQGAGCWKGEKRNKTPLAILTLSQRVLSLRNSCARHPFYLATKFPWFRKLRRLTRSLRKFVIGEDDSPWTSSGSSCWYGIKVNRFHLPWTNINS